MSYNEPPEWQGRGIRSREGWPNETFNPGSPRSHRATTNDPAGAAAGPAPVRRDDTGEFRPSREPYYEEMPTDPALRYNQGGPVTARPELVVPAGPEPPEVQHVILPIPRADDPVERFDLWLRVIVHMLAVVALVAALWCLGMVIADHGVPLWVPRS
jgi:hypothetical protein